MVGPFRGLNLAAQVLRKLSSDPTGGYLEAVMTVDNLGYVYVAGKCNPQADNNDAVVFKSSAGLVGSTGPSYPLQQPGQRRGCGYGIAMDAAGSLYVAGAQRRYDINQADNLWIRKYAQDGSELWSQEFHSTRSPATLITMDRTPTRVSTWRSVLWASSR